MSHINCKFKQLSEKHLPCSRYWEKKKEEKKNMNMKTEIANLKNLCLVLVIGK